MAKTAVLEKENATSPDDSGHGANIKTSRTGEAAEVNQLCKSAIYSEKQLVDPRLHRVKFIRRFAGPNYGKIGETDRDPINMLYSLVTTFVPTLAVDPKAAVTTAAGDLLPFAQTFRLAINDELKKIKLAATMKIAVTEALFGMGIIKTGLQDAGEGAWGVDEGGLFCEAVAFSDWIVDMTTNRQSKAQYYGNRYWFTEDQAVAMDFDKEEIERLSAVKGRKPGRGGESGDLGADGGMARSENEFIRRLEGIDLFLPSKQLVVTVPGDLHHANGKYLKRVEWEGDPTGPFDTLGFTPVPDNMLPLPVIAAIFDLHQSTNSVARKIKRQADRQKDFLGFQKGHEADGEAARTVNDGEVIGFDNLDSVRPFSMGGVNATGYETVAWLQDQANHIAGNPDILGGLSADSNTLGQDQLQAGNASKRIDEWAKTVMDAATSVVRKIGGYVWDDPTTRRELVLAIGGGLKVRRVWDGDRREGELADYDLSVDANHRPPMSPDEAYRRVRTWITEILGHPQVAAAAAAQGKVLDVEKVAEITATHLGIDNADDMFVSADELTQPPATAGRTGGGGDRTQNQSMGRQPRRVEPGAGRSPGQTPPATQTTQSPNTSDQGA